MPNSPKILVVDDSQVVLLAVERMLSSEGFRTVTANSAPMARKLCSTEAPDLILLDVMLPGESGLDLCRSFRNQPATSDIPIIFLSNLDDVAEKVDGLHAGAVDYIPKPVHKSEVLARVRTHLRVRASSREQAQEQRARLDALGVAQRHLLVSPDDLPDANFAVRYQPLEEAGGDFYDVLPVAPGVFDYFVADISGHGLPASFLTSAIKALLLQFSGPLYSPEDCMRGIDGVIRQITGGETYLTAVHVRLNRNTRRMSVLSAGHPPILLQRAGVVQQIQAEGDALGIFASLALRGTTLSVERGDRLFLYTDGMIEAGGQSRKLGLERLAVFASGQQRASLADAVNTIASNVYPAYAARTDDVLLLGIDVNV